MPPPDPATLRAERELRDTMDVARLQAIQARLSDDWPAGNGIECDPRILGGWPRLVGTRWSALTWHGVHILYGGDADATDRYVASMWPDLTPEQVATARAYILAHLPLFDARAAHVETQDGWEGLYRSDVAMLLADRDAARRARTELETMLIEATARANYAESGNPIDWEDAETLMSAMPGVNLRDRFIALAREELVAQGVLAGQAGGRAVKE
jgi:uncharacterized protein (DUF433 family)